MELPPLYDTSHISIERTSTSDDQSATISLGRITTSNNPSIGNTPLELSLNNNHSLAVRLVNSHRDRENNQAAIVMTSCFLVAVGWRSLIVWRGSEVD